MGEVEVLKDPVLKVKAQQPVNNPSGDAADELEEQDMNTVTGAGGGFSAFLGNKGKYCTITKECMPICGN